MPRLGRTRALLAAALLGALAAGCSGPAADSGEDGPSGRASVLCFGDVKVTPTEQSASEVSLAINPINPDHVVAAANSGGGFGVYTSLDGGTTWSVELLTEAILGPRGATTGSLSDPAVAFGPDGTLHIAGLAYIPTSSVFVASRDEPTGPWRGSYVWQSEVAATMNDKEWLGVNPATGTLVVAWQNEPLLDSLRSVDGAVQTLTGIDPDTDVGQILVSRSTDGGRTWSTTPTVASTSLHNNGTQVAFTADGRAHLAWVDYEAPGLVHAVSTDDGATWGDPQPIADIHLTAAIGSFSRMHTLPGLTAFGDEMAIVWHDARNDAGDVMVSRYDGAGWSAMERVPDDAVDVQLYPWAAIDGDGVLHVGYYSGAYGGEYWYSHVRNVNGTWTAPTRVSQPFILASNAFVANIGDYTAVAAHGTTVHSAWAQPNEEQRANVHVSTIRPLAGCAPGQQVA